MTNETMKLNVQQMIKVLGDMKVMCTLLHRTAEVIGINEKDDSYLHTFLASMEVSDVEDAIMIMKNKLEKLDEEKLYVIKAEIGKELIVEEVRVNKSTDKLYKINVLGYNQVNKSSDLDVVKYQGEMLFVFTNDVENGKAIISSAIQSNMMQIRDRLKEYSDLLAKMEN